MAETFDYRLGRVADIRLPEGANFSADFAFTGISLTGYVATLSARRASNGGKVPFTWSKSGLTVGATAISFDITPSTTDDAGKAFSTVTARGATDYALTIRQSGGGPIVMRLQGTVEWVDDVGDFDPGTAGSNQVSVIVGSGTSVSVAVTNAGHPAVTVSDTSSIDLTLTGQQISAAAIFGTSAGTVCQGNDARLSDARTPITHASSHVTGGSDKIRDASASQDGLMTSAQASKLDGIAAGANNYVLPTPTTTTMGGVKRNTGSAGQYVSGIDTDGALVYGTPAGGGGGSGDVTGPASSVDNQIARFDGTTGKVIQTSSVTITDDGVIRNVAGVVGLVQGGQGGTLGLNGGENFVTEEGTFTGGNSGGIALNGSNASDTANGAVGGSLIANADGVNAGGSLFLFGLADGPGGNIDTSGGGGSISTRGTGTIELGQTGTRTTLEGTATSNRAIDLPDESGTLVIGPVTALKISSGNSSAGQALVSDGSGGASWQTAGVPDGDKGDISVSNSGASWIIDNGAVSLAKMANMATASLLGRSTAGTGSPEVLSASTARSLLNVADGANNYTHPNHTGDVTSAGDGATVIANDAVTYAKIQNVSATSRVLGRKSSGSGDAEECTLSEVLDFVGSAARGDILYRGASTWTRLGAGTSGRFLRTNGTGADPSWNTAPVETAVITSNYTDSTGTLGNVTGMSFSLAANERVTAIFSGLWGTATTNSGFRYDITGPGSPTYVLYNVAHGTTQTAFRSGDGATAFSTAFLETTGNAALYLPITIHLHAVAGASGGTVQLRMGGETNGVTFTLYQGFTMQLFRF